MEDHLKVVFFWEGGGVGAEVVVSGVGRQTGSEKGLSLQARPLSTCPPPPAPCAGADKLGQLGLLWLVAAGKSSWEGRPLCLLPPSPSLRRWPSCRLQALTSPGR